MTALKEEFLLNSWESGREVGRREMAKEIIDSDYWEYLDISDLKAQLRAKYLGE